MPIRQKIQTGAPSMTPGSRRFLYGARFSPSSSLIQVSEQRKQGHLTVRFEPSNPRTVTLPGVRRACRRLSHPHRAATGICGKRPCMPDRRRLDRRSSTVSR